MRPAGIVLLVLFIFVAAASAQDERNHLLIRDAGVAEFRPVAAIGEGDWTSVISSRFISSQNDVRTGSESKAHLQFFITEQDVARVVLLDNVQVSVQRLDLDRNVRTVTLRQKNGRIWVDAKVSSGRQQHFSVQTPSATIAVRGTRFYSEVAADGTTRAGCAEGKVSVTAQERTVTLRSGFFTIVRPGSPPDPPRWDTQEFGPRPRTQATFSIDLGTIFVPRRGGRGPQPPSRQPPPERPVPMPPSTPSTSDGPR